MDLPLYTENSISNGAEVLMSVFPRFFRVSLATGDIIVEYGAAHILNKAINLADFYPPRMLPQIPIPSGSVFLDRYPELRPSRIFGNPCVVLATKERGRFIEALHAMQPADVSHMQLDDNGCGPAVVARLTGQSYAQAAHALFPSGKVSILGTQRLADASGTKRHWCKRNTWKEVQEAKAVAVLIKNTLPRLGRHYGHFVSIDPGMVIVDPELVMHYPLEEYPRATWTPLMYFTRA